MGTLGPLPVVLAAGMLASACAGPARPEPSGSEASSIAIELQDAGETVALHVGDRLVLSLEPIAGHPWAVTRYPTEILTPLQDQRGASGWVFAAVAAGEGRIIAFNRAACGPPQLRSAPGGSCVTDALGAAAWPGRPPGSLFTVTVVITDRTGEASARAE